MKLALLQALNAERRARRPAVLVTPLVGEGQRLVNGDAVEADELAAALEPALRSGKSGLIEHGGQQYFLNVQTPTVRLILIGAVQVSRALAPMAHIAGLDVIIIDPRTAFAVAERFPDARIVAQSPAEALASLPLDRYTAIALLTHDSIIDDPALVEALRADCCYIGALGSRKTHAKRLQRMRAEGFDEPALARIHASIGLDIGAVSPAEIAVSILAEIIAGLRRKPPRDSSPIA